MKTVTLLLSSAMLLSLLACNNEPAKQEEAKSDTTVATKPPEPAPFQPFKVIMIQHKVKDYSKWLTVYKADDSARMANGINQFVIGRDLADSNMVYVTDIISDVAKAKAFGSSAGLKAAMQKGGVISTPKVSFAELIRLDSSTIPQKERIMVAHHVKDFDAWLKVYDAEGKAARASNGMVDRAMARGVDDPNMVYLVFAITDMEKAKARGNSPEMKKIMEEAGVDSKPTITMYRIADVVK